MIKYVVNEIIEFFSIMLILALAFMWNLSIESTDVFFALIVAIIAYFFVAKYSIFRKCFYLILFDLLQENFIFTNLLVYFITELLIIYLINTNQQFYNLISSIFFILIFVVLHSVLGSLYYSFFIDYFIVIKQIIFSLICYISVKNFFNYQKSLFLA